MAVNKAAKRRGKINGHYNYEKKDMEKTNAGGKTIF